MYSANDFPSIFTIIGIYLCIRFYDLIIKFTKDDQSLINIDLCTFKGNWLGFPSFLINL